MPACPHCGFSNPPRGLSCLACGGTLSAASRLSQNEREDARATRSASAANQPAQRTLLGIKPPDALAPPSITHDSPQNTAQHRGVPSTATSEPTPPTTSPPSASSSLPSRPPSFARTLLYVQAPAAGLTEPELPDEASAVQRDPAPPGASRTPQDKKRTLLGLSPPQQLLQRQAAVSPASSAPLSDTVPEATSSSAALRQAAEGGPPPPLTSTLAESAPETLSQPGTKAAADALSPGFEPTATAAAVVDTGPSSDAGLVASERPAPNPARQGRRVLSLAAALLLGLLAFFFWWTPPKPLGARLEMSEEHVEMLVLTCENCPSGSTVRVGQVLAAFEGGRAALPLESDLTVGENRLQARVERPGFGRDEDVELVVPVQYRLRTDLSELSADDPQLAVEIEAVPGTEVELNGQRVALEAGRARVTIRLPLENEGQHSEPLWTEHPITYVILTPDGQRHQKTIVQRVSVPPLLLTAPARGAVIEAPQVYVAGRTAAGAAVTVAGHSLRVDSDGQFGGHVPLTAWGPHPLTVRSVAPGHALRRAAVRISRVEDLKRYAQQFQNDAVRRYSTLKQHLSAGEQPRVALPGRVESSAISLGTTTILLSVTSGCPSEPCLAKVVHHAPLTLKNGQRLSVFGEGTGLVQSPIGGREVPEIASMFVLQ